MDVTSLQPADVGLQALGYVGIGSDHLDDWNELAAGMLGMQLADSTHHSRTFRMDDRKQRIVVSDDAHTFFGWEVADSSALDTIVDRLDARAIPYWPLGHLTGQRFVTDGIAVDDPVGNRLEIFHGAAVTDDPFVPGRDISGFRTGALGLGHAVLTAPDIQPLAVFYSEVLGFRVSDYFNHPFTACFFHLNPRHHSLALVQMPFVGIHHLMVEMMMMDDVGQAYDIAQTRPDQVNVTLGRHTNDNMFSFYANTPSKFMIECGWGGRSIDPEIWEPFEASDGPSLWGHERGWLDEQGRAEARKVRMAAAAAGVRAPVHVQDGNYQSSVDCPWFTGIRGTDAFLHTPYGAANQARSNAL